MITFLAQYLATFTISFFFFWPNVWWNQQWKHGALTTGPSGNSLHRTIQSMGFSRPEYWNGWHCPYPGDLPTPGIELGSPALQADSLPAEPQRKPILFNRYIIFHSKCIDLPRLINHLLLMREVVVSVLFTVITLQWTWTCNGQVSLVGAGAGWMSRRGKSTGVAEGARAQGCTQAPGCCWLAGLWGRLAILDPSFVSGETEVLLGTLLTDEKRVLSAQH